MSAVSPAQALRVALVTAARGYLDGDALLLGCYANELQVSVVPTGKHPDIKAPAWSLASGAIFVREEECAIKPEDEARATATGRTQDAARNERLVAVLIHEAAHVFYRHVLRARPYAGVPHAVLNVLQDCEIHESCPWIVDVLPNVCTYELCCARERAEAAVRCGSSKPAWEHVLACFPQQQQQQRPAPSGGCGSTEASAQFGTTEEGKQADATGPIGSEAGHHGVVRAAIERAKRARTSSTSRGRGDGTIARDFDAAAVEPTKRVDWRAVLRRAFARATEGKRSLETYRVANRRQDAYGRLLRRGQQQIGVNVALIVDVSGSMSDVVEDITREVATLGKAAGGKIFGLAWDTREISRVSTGSATRAAEWAAGLSGGGGTSTAAAFAVPEVVQADVVVFVTDLLTDWPDTPPRGGCVILTQEDPEESAAHLPLAWYAHPGVMIIQVSPDTGDT